MNSPRILLTGYADLQSSVNAVNDGGICKYISKPWNDAALLLDVASALEQSALVKEKRRLDALVRLQNRELAELNASLEAKVEARTADLRSAHESLSASFHNSLRVFSGLIESRFGSAGSSSALADLALRAGNAAV